VTEQELRAKEREIIAATKTVYAELFMAQRAVEIAREQLDILRTVIRATEARYQVGKVTQQDVIKALLEQSEIMNQQIMAEADAKLAEVKLNSIMSRPPQTAIQLPADLPLPTAPLADSGLSDLAL